MGHPVLCQCLPNPGPSQQSILHHVVSTDGILMLQDSLQNHLVPFVVLSQAQCNIGLGHTAWQAGQLAAGIPCQAYHAGRPAKERSQVLEDWNEGQLPVVAATIAFGMGIDRASKQHCNSQTSSHSRAIEPAACHVCALPLC